MPQKKAIADYIKKTAMLTFNEAWNLLDKKKLNSEEKIRLLQLVQTSYYLWQQVPECTDTNISISLWQISRAYSKIGDAANALLYAEQNIRLCKSVKPDDFYTAYAHESAARAYAISGNNAMSAKHIKHAVTLIKTTKETHLDAFNKDIAALKEIV